MQLTDLPGIAPTSAPELRFVMSIADLAPEPKEARLVWGSLRGERFWYELHGVDIQSVTGDCRSSATAVLSPQMRLPDRAHRRPRCRSRPRRACAAGIRHALAFPRAEWNRASPRPRYRPSRQLRAAHDSIACGGARSRHTIARALKKFRSGYRLVPSRAWPICSSPSPTAHPRRGAVAFIDKLGGKPGRHRRRPQRGLAAISRRQDRLHRVPEVEFRNSRLLFPVGRACPAIHWRHCHTHLIGITRTRAHRFRAYPRSVLNKSQVG
jgi:hypothetical protein